MIICPNCKNPNEPGAIFCDQCGTSLAGVAPAGAPPTLIPQPAPPAPSGSGSTCPNCGAAVIPGEAFCDNCGYSLTNFSAPVSSQPAVQNPPSSGPIVTPPPAQPSITPAPVITPPPVVTPPPVSTSARLIASDGVSYVLSGKSSYLIGREDAVSGIFPDVDTTNSGGIDGGVSRRHAEIIQQGTQWFLQDLNSVNGTFVNNQRLAPNARQPLTPGSQIRLGRWMATFQL